MITSFAAAAGERTAIATSAASAAQLAREAATNALSADDAWNRLREGAPGPPIVPTGAAVYNHAYGWLGRQLYAPLPDRHANHGRSALFADADLCLRAQRRRRARNRRQQADGDDAFLCSSRSRFRSPTKSCAARRSTFGGPVQVDRGFVLHRPLGNWQSTLAIDDDVGLTTSKDVLEAVARGEGPKDVIISLGYAGWSAGQLEEEIAQNAWLTVAADPHVLFDTRPKDACPRRCGSSASTTRDCPAMSGTHDAWARPHGRARRRSSRSISEHDGSASRWAMR
jgi:hypothetical protein